MKSLLFYFIFAAILLAPLTSAAQMFQTVPADQAQLIQTGPGKLYCPNCGMNLITFYKTSHALGCHQYCSLHCLVDANAETDSALVVDLSTRKLIPCTQAYYVVGSEVKGTMTMTSKYAFADKSAAETFATEHGGDLKSFDEAVAIARKDLADEKKMITKKREGMTEKGRKIYKALCGETELPSFLNIAEAKTYLAQNHPCGELTDKQYQALAIFLISRQKESTGLQPIVAPKEAKCPVCGMYSALYPNWIAEAKTAGDQAYYFDGVKDLMKFYFQPDRYHAKLTTEELTHLSVTDYYDLGAVPARRAWYVIGSNVFGPMGNELIPFRNQDEAQVFSKDHFGKVVVTFDQITLEMVQNLDK